MHVSEQLQKGDAGRNVDRLILVNWLRANGHAPEADFYKELARKAWEPELGNKEWYWNDAGFLGASGLFRAPPASVIRIEWLWKNLVRRGGYNDASPCRAYGSCAWLAYDSRGDAVGALREAWVRGEQP
jgi:hypothetical protein